MSIKLLKRLSCGIISGVCCCLFCLLLAKAANADVCFLPTGECEAAGSRLSSGCNGFDLAQAKDETGWSCTKCGDKWKCEKKSCKDDYQTGIRCTGTETKVCDETRKAGDESCCKCEDSETKCQHEGYVYKKTDTNENCKNKCPYNGDMYESCECNAAYDKATDTDKCYEYATCELGDLAGTKKYKVKENLHVCESYKNNAQYVDQNSETYKNGENYCVLVCAEECTKMMYYQCSPKKDDDPCANGPYSWRDTECCAKDEWKNSKFCQKPTCTITAGDKKFTDLIYPYQVTDFVPKVCDDRLKEGLGIGNLQYGCSSRNTNYVLGMIRYCGGINDFAGIDDINALAGEMYGRSFTNNAAPGVYERCEISASKLPKYTGFTGSAGASTLYNKIKSHALGRLDDFWINVRECYNGDESGMVNFFFDSYKYGVFHAPVLSSNPYNRGMCVCRDEEEKPCNATNYPYVKASGVGATAFGGVNWDDNTIIRYLNSLGSIYAAHTDHLEGDFDNEIFNKIADDANECTDENGVKRYDKICSGRPESKCVVSETRKFTPNGCTSSTYIAHYNGRRYYKPSGTTWGECKTVCSSLGSQYYNSYAECLAQTGKAECFSEKGCWRSCESAGYYSTEADCSGGKTGVCIKKGSCYAKDTFYIRYKPGQTRTQHFHTCSNNGGASGTASWWASLTEGNEYLGIPTDANGIKNGDITDSKREFKSGTYYLCVGVSDSCGVRNWGIKQTQIVGYLPGANGEPSYGYTPGGSYCFADTISGNSYATGCDQTEKYGPHYSCHSYTLEAGFIYEVSATADW